jgi:hypothetical protein
VKYFLTGPSQQCREKNRKIIGKNYNTRNKYTMGNNIYMGYQYQVCVQGYEVIEGNRIDNKQ